MAILHSWWRRPNRSALPRQGVETVAAVDVLKACQGNTNMATRPTWMTVATLIVRRVMTCSGT